MGNSLGRRDHRKTGNYKAAWEVWSQHYRIPIATSSPTLSPDFADGGTQRQGTLFSAQRRGLESGGRKVRTALHLENSPGPRSSLGLEAHE